MLPFKLAGRTKGFAMRHTAWAVLLAALFTAGCGLNEFDVSQSGTATVAGASLLGQVLNTLPPMQGFNDFDLSQTQAFENQNAQKDHVSSTALTAFTLKITSPPSQDFGFLDTVAFFVSADGLPKVRVAHKEGIAALGLTAPNPTLTLDLDQVELAPYVKADSMNITAEVNGRQPSSDTALTAAATFHVKVKL